MLTSGAGINRVEDTIQRMLYAYGCVRVDVFSITSSIVVTVQDKDGEIYTQTRRILAYETNLNKVERCNALSRQVCRKTLELDRLSQAVEEIRTCTDYSDGVILVAYGCISAAFSVFFGGTAGDGIAAFIGGLLLYFVGRILNQLHVHSIILTILSSMCVALSAAGLTWLGLGDSVDKIIIGNIMLLIPGISLTTALRDMISGDTISGLLGLCEALIRALAIAIGFAAVLWRFQG
ncbi:MAG: threonine/serine exporter family protein [Lachnospiraceae bacterium]|nr:threonine/serine exporter family protein [Lachnospiraceae bacterium]